MVVNNLKLLCEAAQISRSFGFIFQRLRHVIDIGAGAAVYTNWSLAVLRMESWNIGEFVFKLNLAVSLHHEAIWIDWNNPSLRLQVFEQRVVAVP